ncbi:MAG: cardiolipin synthase ClsB [Rhodocyclaceae bacterium]|nr:MAG: cardiolipin synthase ClsB [Rhodocyclaceae bacterium]
MTAFISGNRVRLLENGADFFPALLAAIEGAEREIHLETYIFADDEVGRSVAAALARAAQRGVTVRVLVDGFGARDFTAGLGAMLRADGVEVAVYRPEVARLRFRRHRLRRLHRKLAVMDNEIAFIGGINIVDDWDNLHQAAQVPPRFDYAAMVEGPMVAQVRQTMAHLWHLVRWSQLRRRGAGRESHCPLPQPAGQTACALLIRDNLRHRRDIEDAYLAAINGAERDILIANAYFLPGRRFRQTLMDAASRGVRVTLLVQGRVEYLLQHYATRSLYRRLLAAGIRIHEYQRSFLHAKVAVVDGHWATVGSSNIDPFSLLLAREANLVVEDRTFAALMTASLERAVADGAQPVLLEDMKRQSRWERWASALAYFLVRLAVGVSRYGGAEYRE